MNGSHSSNFFLLHYLLRRPNQPTLWHSVLAAELLSWGNCLSAVVCFELCGPTGFAEVGPLGRTLAVRWTWYFQPRVLVYLTPLSDLMRTQSGEAFLHLCHWNTWVGSPPDCRENVACLNTGRLWALRPKEWALSCGVLNGVDFYYSQEGLREVSALMGWGSFSCGISPAFLL